jgi:Subtilase family
MRRPFFFALLLVFAAVSSYAGHFVYSPGRALTDADRAELASRGIVVQRALSGGRYVVSTDPARTRDGVASDAFDGLEPFTPEQKIHRSAIRMMAKAKPYTRLVVMFHDDVTFEAAAQAIRAAGANFEDPLALDLGVMQQADVVVPSGALEALASDDRVLAVTATPALKIRSDNVVTAGMSHVTELHSAPYDLTGKDLNASLFELAAAQADHPEFGGRLKVNTTGGTTSDQQHATHVAGTIAAGGVSLEAKGMAPAVTLHQFRASGTPSQWLRLKRDSLPPLGVGVDNNSWGYVLGWDTEGSDNVWTDLDVYFGAYDLAYTAPIDQIARERNILFVHSAGNEADLPSLNQRGQHRHQNEDGDTITDRWYCYSQNGSGTDCVTPCSPGPEYCEVNRHMTDAPFDTIGLTASAKNSVTVGAIDQAKFIADFSGRGPTKDGRVKPDLVARGVNVLSSSNPSTYTRKGGTSMASPAVAGIAVLITEQWRRTFANVGPTPEQLKAVFIAGADDLGNAGPDYTFGYGLANAKASVDLIRADAAQATHIKTEKLAHSARYETSVRAEAGQPMRVVLQWLDPEIVLVQGEDEVADKALVNDLDLTVTDPAGNVVLPWLLNPSEPNANAARGVNRRDNTEVVEIANPAAGIYRISVNATSVVDRSPQSFTLVTNATAGGPCVDVFEANNSADAAYGDLAPSYSLHGAICSAADVDFYRFSVTKAGDVSVVVNATGDTPIRVTVTRSGAAAGTVDVPAGQSRTVSFNVAGSGQLAQAVPVVVKFEAVPGSLALTPSYTFTPNFGQFAPAKRRTTKK